MRYLTLLLIFIAGFVFLQAMPSYAETPAAQGAAVAATPAAPAATPVAVPPPSFKTNQVLTISMFVLIIAFTLGIVVSAARKTKTASDFYAAGGGITGMQNGWAIAGDYMSAASFLGTTGLISLFGFDGIMYAVGAVLAYMTVLLVVAEPCRNLGKYTLGDILSFRTSPKKVRAAVAISTVAVSTFYLIAQMVGAGKLMQLLLGVSYTYAIIGVGSLMVLYVVFGGMKATTWVQIIKAVLLMAATFVLMLLVLAKVGFNPFRLLSEVAASQAIQDHVRLNLLKEAVARPGFDYGQRFLEPGLLLKDPLDQISLGMAFFFGTAGLPHILMRFFTVPDAKAARKSVVVAMLIIGSFFMMVLFLGFGASLYLTPAVITQVDRGGNMAVLLLAQMLGGGAGSIGGDLLLAFLCAVAFATILAVVSGLVLAASAAIAHDIYVSIFKGGSATQAEQVRAARITAAVVGCIAIVIGLVAESQNVAHLTVLALSVASSGNIPVVVLSLFWRKFNTAGIIAGLTVGTLASLMLVLVSPNMTYPKIVAAGAKKIYVGLEEKQAAGVVLGEKDLKVLAKAKADYEANKDGTSLLGLDAPLFPLKNPGIVSIPLGFLAAIVGALLFRSRRSEEMFDELYVRENTGIGIAKPTDH